MKRIRITKAFCEVDPVWGGAGEYYPAGAIYSIVKLNQAEQEGLSAEYAAHLVRERKAKYLKDGE